MPGRRTLIGLMATASLGLLGGCGHTQVIGQDRTLYVALADYRVTPQSVRVRSGPMTIFVHNYGRLTHDLVVSLNGQSIESTRPIWPGQSAELSVSLPPGNYLMASTILSDQALGEYGTLKVTS